jgi:phosphoglucosamine mutase
MESLFGTDGIRGRANCYPVTPELALSLGKAIASIVDTFPNHAHRVLIGKDTRLSGYMLETALTSGLVSMGMNVFLVGPLPTPGVAHLTRSINADIGIMLTASHNPFDDNGIKLFDQNGFKLSDELEQELTERVLGGELTSEHIRSDRLGKAMRIEDARGRYIEYAKSTVSKVNFNGLRIVLDCANGAAYQIAPWIFEELGAEVIKCHASPDGYNINNHCGAVYTDTIRDLVNKYRADAGIAFDGDADRVIFCDRKGNTVDGDRILAIAALDYKERGVLNKNTLVTTCMSNLGMQESLRRHGIETVTTKVGDRNVIERMRSEGYNLGGENCGHLIFFDHATTGDGIISALQVLKLMKEKGKHLEDLTKWVEIFPSKLTSVYVAEKKPIEEMPEFACCIQDCERELGETGRVLVRYSGTENKIRILVEARNESDVSLWTNSLIESLKKEVGVQ